ncbi:MAG: TIR domain-containing protein [Pseudomonadota bacterium]
MAKVFISYSRNDQAFVERLARELDESSHDVWWDRHIKPGAAYSKDIERALADADVALVIWSTSSVDSDWVKDEAVFARDRGKLVPVSLDGCDPPLGFRQYQAIDFSAWKGDPKTLAFSDLLEAIAGRAGEQAPERHAPEPPSALGSISAEKALPIGAIVAAIGAALIAVFALLSANRNDAGRGPTAIASDVFSIAVLPFADMNDNSGYFAQGLSEDVIFQLMRTPGLEVASPTSARAMRDRKMSAGEIADELRVGHILDGRVNRSDNGVTVTAQLIDARTDRQIWSNTYESRGRRVFEADREIVNDVLAFISDTLGVESISRRDQNVLARSSDQDLDTYDKYLKARRLFNARGRKNLSESLTLFESVVAEKPDYAQAWEGLAAVYAVAKSYGIDDRDYSKLAISAAERAIELNPDLSTPYATIGLALRDAYPVDWSRSVSSLETAIAKDPKNTDAYAWLGLDYIALGEAEKAMKAFDECLEIDNALKPCLTNKAIAYLIMEQYEDAIAIVDQNIADGHFVDLDAFIPTFILRGDLRTARLLSRLMTGSYSFPHRQYIDALSSKRPPTDNDYPALEKWMNGTTIVRRKRSNYYLAFRAFNDLDARLFAGDFEDLWLPTSRDFRATPTFKTVVRDLGLVDYWQNNGYPPLCRATSDDDFSCVAPSSDSG